MSWLNRLKFLILPERPIALLAIRTLAVRIPALRTLAIRTLAVRTPAVRTLAVRTLAVRTLAVSVLAVSGLVACEGGAGGGASVPNEAVGTPPPPSTRPSDGLLESPALQEVVDLQVARDGDGLRALLRSPDPAVRARAAFALASVQDPEAGSPLTGLLSDSESAVRRDAAFALGQLQDPLYGPALLGALRDEPHPAVRGKLLEALGKVGDGRILEDLLALPVLPEEEAARNLAVSRLGLRGVTLPASITHLIGALEAGADESTSAMNAAYYFGRNGSPGAWAESSNAVRKVLDGLSPDDPVAMQLLLGLSLLGDPGDNSRFLAWLRGSPDWRIRTNAAQGLAGRTADEDVWDALMAALDDPSTHVAIRAADALMGTRQLSGAKRDDLVAWVEDHPAEWRQAGSVLALLGRLGAGDVIRSWLGTWDEDDVVPRTRGIGAMAFVPGPEATEFLVEAAASPQSRIRATALGGLARRWPAEKANLDIHTTYFRAFLEGLRTGDPSAVFVSAPALADSAFLPLGSVTVLMNEYNQQTLPEDLEGMQAILRAIASTGAPEAEDFVRRALDAPSQAIRNTAAEALSTLTEEEVEAPRMEVEEESAGIDWGALEALGRRPRLVLETNKGTVTAVLDTESAPMTVQTVAALAQEGAYDGTPFHRVVPNFVVQGGDVARADGFGGPGFSIRSEFTQIPYRRGVLGMASAGKDTEGSQFFVTHSMARHLDGGYTSFGWVVSGMDVVDMLYEQDRIVTARVVTARVEPDGS